jgi:Ca2+-transporting ATPase
MTGQEFEKLNDEQAGEAASRIKILSRARPMDKMRLVKLLHDKKEVVAVTGDGTNDAPALNYADVGLAMGKTGTAVAKEASDIILLDDSFRSIVNAVMWGRSLYQNIQRFVLFQLTINVAACIIAMLGPFINMEFPLTVIQMLWVNLIMDTFAALALATEPPHWNVMERPPRKSEDFIVTKDMARSIFGVGIIFIVLLIGMIYYFQTNPEHTHKITNFMLQHCPELSADKIKSLSGLVDISFDEENKLRDELVKFSFNQQDIDFIVNKSYTKFTDHELSIFFTFFVLLQFWNLFNARCLGLVQSAFKGMFENKGFVVIATAILVGQILIVQFGGKFFRTVPLSLNDWLIIIGSTSLVLWIGEIWRLVARLSAKK